jgi:hypothetical protein
MKEKQVTWKYDQEYEGTVYTLTYREPWIRIRR